MGNIWRLRYLRKPHQWLLQGEPVATVDYGEEGLFRTANYDWKTTDDLWAEFIEPRFRWLSADAAAPDGVLTLGFRQSVDFPVNAVIVAARGLADRVQADIDRIDTARRETFYGLWQEQRPQIAPHGGVSPVERQRGYIAAEIHCSDDVNPWSRPESGDSREAVEFFATPGAQEQASFAVYALRDLEDVTFSLSDMRGDAGTLPGDAFDLRLVQFAPWHAGRRETPAYTLKECLLLPVRPTFVGAGTCKRFWITFTTPRDTAPGIYSGRIGITAANAPPTSLDLRIRVVPVTLDTPPVERFMYFGTMVMLGRAYLPDFDQDRYWEAIRAEVRFMRDNQYCRAECILPHGMNYLTTEDGKVTDVDLSFTERLMGILREEDAWPRDNTMICRTGSLNLKFGGHFRRPDNPTVEFIPTDEGRANYRQAVAIIDRKAKEKGWPEVAFECLGEFTNYGESGKTFAVAVHSLLHDLGVSNTIRGNGPSDMAPIELGLVAYPQPNWAMMFPEQLDTMRRTGKRLWAYNFSRSRFSLGWFCWKHGITRASYESGVYANGQPGNVFEIPTMFPMGLPTSMTTIEPTLWLKRLVQGAVDYEYLYTLDRRIAKAEQSGDSEAERIAANARKWINTKLDDIPAGSTYVRGDPRNDQDVQGRFWPVHDLDRYRWQAATFIMDIDRAARGGRQ
jgi:hypothetical protein